MTKDSRNALWVSYSTMREFMLCPRAYYLHSVYKDPQTRRKITLVTPPLALGQAVHEVVEELSSLPTQNRMEKPLRERFEMAWQKVGGKWGGFSSEQEEQAFKERGYGMIDRLEKSPGPIERLAVKLKVDLPHFWLSETDDILLCGKIDWLEFLPDQDAVRIIDFKTGSKEEPADSLQLPSYLLLTTNCQKRPVVGAAYWYLAFEAEPNEQTLPDIESARTSILAVAKEMKLARKLNRMKCKQGNGCRYCKPYEAVLAGEAIMVGINDRNQEVYMLTRDSQMTDMSEVL